MQPIALRLRWAMGAQIRTLIAWELMSQRGRRRGAGWAVLAAVTLLAVAAAWWLATLPLSPDDRLVRGARTVLVTVLVATPPRDPLPLLGQMTFGYALLRYAAYGIVALARLILPATAAASVVDDRRSGRLQELQLTLYTAREIYLAKTLAAALPLLVTALLLPLLFAGILIPERVPVLEIARVLLETCAQILVTAAVTVACSARCRSRWTAMLLAWLFLWLLLPAGWLALLLWIHGAISGRWPVDYAPELVKAGDFAAVCAANVATAAGASLLAFAAGVRTLRRIGISGRTAERRLGQAPAGGV